MSTPKASKASTKKVGDVEKKSKQKVRPHASSKNDVAPIVASPAVPKALAKAKQKIKKVPLIVATKSISTTPKIAKVRNTANLAEPNMPGVDAALTTSHLAIKASIKAAKKRAVTGERNAASTVANTTNVIASAPLSLNRQKSSGHFLNRETQLLAFNRRVLAQAEDTTVPLLERLKYLSIVSSNMDEFFEIRVAGLKEQIKLNSVAISNDGQSAMQTFNSIAIEARTIVNQQYALLNDALFPAMAAEGIRFLRRAHWTPAQQVWVKEYFFREVMPVLTPIGLDPAHPFPRIFNKSLNFAVELSGRDAFGRDSLRAIVQAPRVLPRVIRLPASVTDGANDFVFLTSVLHAHVGELFSGLEVVGCYQFRVTRNSDLFVDEEEVKNLRLALQGELPQRHLGDAVRLEVADNCSLEMTQFLLAQFGLEDIDLYRVNGPVNLVRLMNVPDQVNRPDLKFAPFTAGLPKALLKASKLNGNNRDIFETLKKQDVLLHHPFQSFTPVIEFIQTAARDPLVVAIKQTVYRTGTDSVIMEALIDAAKRGKEVTVVVELMARFDEEANLNWAAKLEEVGAHVVYGVVGHKTHAKMALIVRREKEFSDEEISDQKTSPKHETGHDGKHGSKRDAKHDGKHDNKQDSKHDSKHENKPVLRRYVHLGTGNYHPRTARLYTDFGLITANEAICADVNEVFIQLTGLGRATKLSHVWQAPFTLHDKVIAAIDNETKIAKSGRADARGVIIAKMNSLLAPEVIEALYRASAAGVKIDLIVRGVCALRPGVPGLSENIRVHSIVGRFLEHSRIFYFRNGGGADERVMLSSADWMERNFFRRIELCFPVIDPRLKKRVLAEGLMTYLSDNCQAWEMSGDGSYERKKPAEGANAANSAGGERHSAQEELLTLLAVDN